MEYTTLKNTDLKVSRICMGGCPLGGYGWGDTQEQELIDAVHTALECGINFFDTSDTYGLGQSEKLLAKALGNRRKDVIIQTKFGVRIEDGKTYYDNSPEYIEIALNRSLERLNTDYVDIYVIHYRDGKTPIKDVVKKMEELRKQGKIRYFGLSNIHKDEIDELLPYKDFFINFQNEYSLACRKNEQEMNEISEALAINPLTWGSLGQGILTGKYTKDNVDFSSNDRRSREIYVNFHGEKLEKNLEIVDVLKEIAKEHKKSVASVAIRYILDYIPESVVICGAKRSSQILSNVEAIGWNLSEEEIRRLDEISKK